MTEDAELCLHELANPTIRERVHRHLIMAEILDVYHVRRMQAKHGRSGPLQSTVRVQVSWSASDRLVLKLL